MRDAEEAARLARAASANVAAGQIAHGPAQARLHQRLSKRARADRLPIRYDFAEWPLRLGDRHLVVDVHDHRRDKHPDRLILFR